LIKYYYNIRINAYETRRLNSLKKASNELFELKNIIIFVENVKNKSIVLTQPIDQLKLNIELFCHPSFTEQLLEMKTKHYTDQHLTQLQQKLQETIDNINFL